MAAPFAAVGGRLVDEMSSVELARRRARARLCWRRATRGHPPSLAWSRSKLEVVAQASDGRGVTLNRTVQGIVQSVHVD